LHDNGFNDWRNARLLKWQAEGLIIRLDDMGLTEKDLDRWTKISHARKRAFTRFLRRDHAHNRALNALKA